MSNSLFFFSFFFFVVVNIVIYAWLDKSAPVHGLQVHVPQDGLLFTYLNACTVLSFWYIGGLIKLELPSANNN